MGRRAQDAWATLEPHVGLDTEATGRARTLKRVSAALVLIVGGLGLLGWFVDNEALKAGFMSNVAMKTNTTLCLVASGVALLLSSPTGSRSRAARLSAALAAFSSLLGALTLVEHVAGLNMGIDQLLFTERPGQIFTASPNRMGPPAATAFAILGLAQLLLQRKDGKYASLAQRMAVAAALIALLSLLGYLTGATMLYGIARYTGIALSTAVAVFCLSLGVFVARPAVYPAALVLADNAGGQLARTMLPMAIFLAPVLSWLRVRGEALGLYDLQFGRALLLLAFISIFTLVVWQMSLRFAREAVARARAELASDAARAEAARLASENLQTLSVLDSLLAHAPIGLVFFEASGSCVRVNHYLAQLSRSTPDELLGKALAQVLPGDVPGLGDVVSRVFSQGAAIDIEVTRDLEHSMPRVWLASLFPVRDGKGQVTLAGAMLIDISERKRLEAQSSLLLESERAARTEAQRAAHLKDEFLATLSHELRTPLNAVLGWVTVARGKVGLAPDVTRALEIVERNARLQAQLIEDLLDVSRIVSGKLRLELARVDLRTALLAAVSAVAPAMEAKNIRLGTHFLEDGSREVLGDAARLQQILWNLLSNAVKFTPAGGEVVITEKLVDGNIEVAVQDSGVGIRAEFLPHVFDRFRQADASTTRRHGGLGLGLAIVRQLTEVHGGSVRVESAGAGQGATFTVSIPLASSDGASQRPATHAPLFDVSLRGVNILVVDDEPDAREFVARVLMDNEAAVDVAGGVDEALELMNRKLPHVLVSDIGMADRDGYELVAEVRARFDAKQLPAIAVTAFARAEDRRRALSAGFQLHVAKPVDPHELTLAVASLAGRTGKEGMGVKGQAPTPAAVDAQQG